MHRILTAVLMGFLIGGAWGYQNSVSFTAQARIFFPGVEPRLYAQLTQALQADPLQAEFTPQRGEASANKEKVAKLILTSRAAAQVALVQVTPAGLDAFSRDLTVTETQAGGLNLQVRAASADTARLRLEGLLNYYRSFVKEHSLSPATATRKRLEEQLDRVAKQLRKTEEGLARSSDPRLRALGDAAIKADPKIMAQIWLRRTDETNTGRAILETLQKLREAEGKQGAGARGGPEEWLSAGTIRGRMPIPKGSPRKLDLLQRMRLERSYYDCLMKFRSLLLQHSFLTTLEGLDSWDFEFVDPPYVTEQPRWHTVILFGVTGSLIGFALGWLIRGGK